MSPDARPRPMGDLGRRPSAGGRPGGERRAGAVAAPGRLAGLLVGLTLAGCATTRVVPLAGPGGTVDPARGTVEIAGEGVTLVVRPAAWDGSPAYLDRYVTPFHLRVVSTGTAPVAFAFADLRLFDEARFQYTALPPVEVERILRAAAGASIPLVVAAPDRRLAAAPVIASDAGQGRRVPWHRVDDRPWRPGRRWHPRAYALRDPWWWDPFWAWPRPYPPVPLDDVFTRALPAGAVQPGAQVEGFAYFPRLRPAVERLTLEFHYWLGETPGVLTAPFAVLHAGR